MNDQNLPAVVEETTTQTLTESLELNPTEFDEIISSIAHAETYDVAKMEGVRVDATYFKPEKAGETAVLMVAGYSWRKSEFDVGEVPSINLYDVEKKEFLYAMQTALVGKCREAKLPRGQMVRITYLGKVKGKKFSYEDFKVEALVPAKPKSDDDKEPGNGKKK